MKMIIPVSYKSREVLTPSTQKMQWNRASEKEIIMYKLELDISLIKLLHLRKLFHVQITLVKYTIMRYNSIIMRF